MLDRGEDRISTPSDTLALSREHRYISVMETLRRDRDAASEALRCSLLVLARRATPTPTSGIAHLLAGCACHEPALVSRILAFGGLSFKHGPQADVLNVVPRWGGMSAYFQTEPTPAWIRELEKLHYEASIDIDGFLAHYGALSRHPRLLATD